MGLLDRLRPGAVTTEPERSLAKLQARGTWLHLDAAGDPPRDGRVEPVLQVAWWWHDGARTVIVGGRRAVSILGPADVEGGPLRFVEAERIVVVGGGAPAPGRVDLATGASVTLEPHVPAMDTSAAEELATPAALRPLLGRAVELRVAGGSTVDHGGVVLREGTEDLPVPRGQLVAAVEGQFHIVLVLDDGTVAVVHVPGSIQPGDDDAVRLVGDLGRVVLDTPGAEVHVARDATLQVCPVDDGPSGPSPQPGASE